MIRYNYFQALVMSFYSKDLYRDVKENWGGHAILYLLLLLAITWLPITYFMQKGINDHFPGVLDVVFGQMPEVNIKNGIVQTPENRPYFFTDPDNKQIFGIIDTSGKFNTIDKSKAVILVTKNQFITSNNHNEVKTYNISPSLNLHIVPDVYKKTLAEWFRWVWVLIFPLFIIFSFVWRLLQGLFYAIFGKIFAVISGQDIGYLKIFVLTLISITPTIILQTILGIFNISFPFQWFFNFVLAIGYLIFAIRSTYSNKILTPI